MKKLLILSTLFLSFSSWATVPDWKLNEIKAQNNVTAGYIYHSEAAGTVNNEIAYTALKLVCSTTASKPVVGVFWHNLSVPVKSIHMSVDHSNVFLGTWSQEKSFVYTDLNKATDLLKWMTTGKIAYFQIMGDDNIVRQTAFDLRKFNQSFPKFKELCQLK